MQTGICIRYRRCDQKSRKDQRIQNSGERKCVPFLGVEKLYPSIQPELAMQAITDALAIDKTTDKKTKKAIEHYIRLSFENSYVTYQDVCYKSKVGIPTGGSLSRQIADIFLHWILFIKMTPNISQVIKKTPCMY